MKPVLAVTVGDFNGIGPEVALKAVRSPAVRRVCQPVLVGPLDVFAETARKMRLKVPLEKHASAFRTTAVQPVLDVGDGIAADIAWGKPTKTSGRTAGLAIERAVTLCLEGKAAAMVTAPVSKEGLASAGYDFPGQTEMVALLSGSRRVLMMFVGSSLRIGLATVHAPFRDVPGLLTPEKVADKLVILDEALRNDLGVRAPRIAVLGLNPHAGENGRIGSEEETVIRPAMVLAAARKVRAEGPFPADAFFGARTFRSYDAVLAMYHDQGLIPLKYSGFADGVNYSAGLPVIRTSPDHGTAYDIAGTNKADPSSMIAAIMLALRIARTRRSHDRTS